uniref:Syntenic homolog of Saccharomyces cerevisiae YPR104C (FHL1) n=1 Tax=Nonomuraea gerenzanensis TaxID=93944 RepID=A0A1M4E1L9_9ACTN|nr:syntenic homolog of Saccharomyces cerevisiae YPR104C (FHL1) [Nonomuraea gerenzanensis]
MILLALAVAAAGVMSVELVRAADEELDLGGPVVVSPSSSPGSASASRSVREGDAGAPEDGATSEPPPQAEASPSATPTVSGEPVRSERPTPRKTKAEPVKPPSPRPGGGGDDDDDDDGGDDDGDD